MGWGGGPPTLHTPHSPPHTPAPASPTYLVVGGELGEELVPVLLVVVDTEVPADIQVQQEPVRAVHLELVVGFWEGERRVCWSRPPHLQGAREVAARPLLPAWAGCTVPVTLVSQYLFPVVERVIQVMGTIQV